MLKAFWSNIWRGIMVIAGLLGIVLAIIFGIQKGEGKKYEKIVNDAGVASANRSDADKRKRVKDLI